MSVLAYRTKSMEDWEVRGPEISKRITERYVHCPAFTEMRRDHAATPKSVFHYKPIVAQPGFHQVFQMAKHRPAPVTYSTDLLMHNDDGLDIGNLNAVLESMPRIKASGRPFYLESSSYVFGPFYFDKQQRVSSGAPRKTNWWNQVDLGIYVNNDDGDLIFLNEPKLSLASPLDAHFPSDVIDWYTQKTSVQVNFTQAQKSALQQLLASPITLEDQKIARKLGQAIKDVELPGDTFVNLLQSTPALQAYVDKGVKTYAKILDQQDEARQQVRREVETAVEQLNVTIRAKNEQLRLLELQLTDLEKQKQNKLAALKVAAAQVAPEYEQSKEELRTLLQFTDEWYRDIEQNSFVDLSSVTELTVDAEGAEQSSSEQDLRDQIVDYAEDELGIKLSFKVDENIVHRFRDSKVIETVDARLGRLIVSAVGNGKSFVVSTGFDWISYQAFSQACFKQVVAEAVLNPNKLVVLTLLDFNNSPPQCYLREVAAHLSGATTTLPGFTPAWPDNLWLILVPTHTNEETSVGLPYKLDFFKPGVPVIELAGSVHKSVGSYEGDYFFKPAIFTRK